jgi:protein-S-isoprenylcysteine O-methyltransferase Ste14
MVFSAASGAVAVVNGVFVLLGQIDVADLKNGLFGSFLDPDVGIVMTIAFVVLAIAALLYQMRDVGSSITSVDRTSYRY